METRENDPPFAIVLLAFCLVLVQLAVAISGKHPMLWVLALIDFGLAAGLWRGIAWIRWATMVRCGALLALLAFFAGSGAKIGLSWPPVAVAAYGIGVLWLPSSRQWFTRKRQAQAG